jgi:hypothetical protein
MTIIDADTQRVMDFLSEKNIRLKVENAELKTQIEDLKGALHEARLNEEYHSDTIAKIMEVLDKKSYL